MTYFIPSSHQMNRPNPPLHKRVHTWFKTFHILNQSYRLLNSSNRAYGIQKGFKRKLLQNPSLKDERYFDGFRRSLFIVAKSNKRNEVLDPTYTPVSEPEQKELFEAKQTFMISVFNADLQTDMGKTIARRHVTTTHAQAVWRELSEHMMTSSKGASEKRSLTQYVTNTVLDDNFKGATEQIVHHFNEQFRQLEEISDDIKKFPPQ